MTLKPGERPEAYPKEQRERFVQTAIKLGGITAAMDELGFPKSFGTAQRWLKGIDLASHVPDLRALAEMRGTVYSDVEHLEVLSQALDVIAAKFQKPKSLAPGDIQKLASSAQTVIETMRLIDNKPGSITQRMDQVDGEIQRLLTQFRSSRSDTSPKEGVLKDQLKHQKPANSHLPAPAEGADD